MALLRGRRNRIPVDVWRRRQIDVLDLAGFRLLLDRRASLGVAPALAEVAWSVSFGLFWPLFAGYVFDLRLSTRPAGARNWIGAGAADTDQVDTPCTF